MDEQWKLNGDCKICRRNKYCSKQCKVRQDSIRGMITDIVTSRMLDFNHPSRKGENSNENGK